MGMQLPPLPKDPLAILAVPADEPERLFPGDAAAAKQRFRELAAAWHPDRNADARATEVFQHVGVLYKAAAERIAAGTWRTPGLLVLQATDGRTFQMRWRRRRAIEVGEMLVAPRSVVFLVEKANRDLFDAAVTQLQGLHYADAGMKAEFARYLPQIRETFETAEHLVLVMDKTPDVVLLADLVEYLGGRLDPKHAAWVLSSLLNIACYLQWAGLTHNAIAADTVFVSPRYHTALLLGGWWYAATKGNAMRAAPGRSVAAAPADVLTAKVGDPRLDLQCIRLLGREILGDAAGTRLAANGVPAPVADWLRIASAGSARDDYRSWARARDTGFGERRFVDLPVDPETLYPPLTTA